MRALRALRALYDSVMRVMKVLPFGVAVLDKGRMMNRVGTANVIRLCHEMDFTPDHLVDVGARNSEWAWWLTREYPGLAVISYDPAPGLAPLGHFHNYALDDRHTRFDAQHLNIGRQALLKIDAEEGTAAALRGFGDQIHRFRVVVVEMWNYEPGKFGEPWLQQGEIWQFMLDHGFAAARVVDCAWTSDGPLLYDIAFFKPFNARLGPSIPLHKSNKADSSGKTAKTAGDAWNAWNAWKAYPPSAKVLSVFVLIVTVGMLPFVVDHWFHVFQAMWYGQHHVISTGIGGMEIN